jgi:hypothetical protein
MTSIFINKSPYLRVQRKFPEEISVLIRELDKAYIDTANAVNARTIGLFPINRAAVTGESYYIRQNQRQQTFRQVFTFITTNPIPHGLNLDQLDYFTNNFGQFTDGTNWYGLISASNVAIAGQISFYVDPTNINFLVGAGAPVLTKGLLVLQWMSNP